MTTQTTPANPLSAMMFAARQEPTPTPDTRALITAAARGNADDVARLLNTLGADPEGIDDYGFSALSAAAMHGNAECVALLLPHCDATRELDGSTPLHDAALFGHVECLRLLLPLCDPNATIAPGLTPLMLAESAGHPECVELLRAASEFHADCPIAEIEAELTLADRFIADDALVARDEAERQATKRARRAKP